MFAAEVQPRAILLTGSAAEGTADWLSDLDLIVYHDRMPAADRLDRVPGALGADMLPPSPPWSETGYGQRFELGNLEVQAGHMTVDHWDRRLSELLAECRPDDPGQKVLGHYLEAVPLLGEELIGAWQARVATYPDGWAAAMVEHNLRIFPLWQLQDQVAARDATLWTYEMLVQGAERVLGMLAGLNRVYWSGFQFKRAHAFEARLRLRPARLADRIDYLFQAGTSAAIRQLESLVAETLDLVEEHMPGIETAPLRASLGARHWPWGP